MAQIHPTHGSQNQNMTANSKKNETLRHKTNKHIQDLCAKTCKMTTKESKEKGNDGDTYQPSKDNTSP